MKQNMVDAFLATQPNRIHVIAIGDLIGQTQSENVKFNTETISAITETIQTTRLFDLRPQWPTMIEAVHQLDVTIASDDENTTFTQLSDDNPLPLYGLPAIGIYGWYQTEDAHATIVAPAPYPGGTACIDIFWLPDTGDGDRFFITLGTYLLTKDAEWQTGIHVAPLGETTKTMFYAMPAEDRPAWLNTPMPFSPNQTGQQQAMFLVRRAKAILLTNTFIQCKKEMIKKSSTPPKARAKTRKLTGKKGSPGRKWIDLPGQLQHKDGKLFTVGTGKQQAFHPVRGHPRTLRSEKYTNMQGETIWVRPYGKGSKDLGTSTTPYRIK